MEKTYKITGSAGEKWELQFSDKGLFCNDNFRKILLMLRDHQDSENNKETLEAIRARISDFEEEIRETKKIAPKIVVKIGNRPAASIVKTFYDVFGETPKAKLSPQEKALKNLIEKGDPIYHSCTAKKFDGENTYIANQMLCFIVPGEVEAEPKNPIDRDAKEIITSAMESFNGKTLPMPDGKTVEIMIKLAKTENSQTETQRKQAKTPEKHVYVNYGLKKHLPCIRAEYIAAIQKIMKDPKICGYNNIMVSFMDIDGKKAVVCGVNKINENDDLVPLPEFDPEEKFIPDAEPEKQEEPEKPEEPEKGYTITGNEIYFDKKPEQKIIDSMKNAGMRWNPYKKCWMFRGITADDAESVIENPIESPIWRTEKWKAPDGWTWVTRGKKSDGTYEQGLTNNETGELVPTAAEAKRRNKKSA